MIAIVDYGVGNLFSLQNAFAYLGIAHTVTASPRQVAAADAVVLPGVGAFSDAAQALLRTGLGEAVKTAAANGVPVLGICLGMQLLFEKSHEFGLHEGLCLLPGEVRPLCGRVPQDYKVPHMGWNKLQVRANTPLLQGLEYGPHVYYVHSFYADTAPECVFAASDYGIMVPGIVGRANVMGAQFHPEKSGGAGLRILQNFAALAQAAQDGGNG